MAFSGIFNWEWATHDLLYALLCVLLMQCTICTLWGQRYRRHSRIALSGAYVIQAMESWYSTLLIIRASLSSRNFPKDFQRISRFCPLGASVSLQTMYTRTCFGTLCRDSGLALLDSADFLDYSLKDNTVSIGSARNFNWLGYDIINGLAYLSQRTLESSKSQGTQQANLGIYQKASNPFLNFPKGEANLCDTTGSWCEAACET